MRSAAPIVCSPVAFANKQGSGSVGTMEYKKVRPSQALLDPENPRLPDGTSNDREAINRLLAEGYAQMLALARDLVDRGEGNPSELPIVMASGSKFVVLEGNRRFAALKLLGDPKLAEDKAQQLAFARIKSKGKSAPKALFCAVARDRDDADPWITLRHTGANDGVGIRVWSAQQNARHRQRMKAPVDSGTLRSIAFADELTEAYQADTALVELINKVRADKLTNIGRLFSGVTLSRMQFALRQVGDGGTQTLWAKHTADELHDFFLWAFEHLDANSVDTVKNDPVRGDLLNQNAHLLPSPANSLPEYRRLADWPYSPASDSETVEAAPPDDESGAPESDGGTSSPVAPSDSGSTPTATAGAGAPGDAPGGRQRDKKDERCLYSDVRLPNLSAAIQRLLREAKQLPINDNYATACILARVILELSVSDPKVLTWSGKNEGDKLADKINACIFKLDPNIDSISKRSRPDLVQARLEVKEIGVAYLHQFMHNPAARADPHLARRFSSTFTPLLNGIDQAVK